MLEQYKARAIIRYLNGDHELFEHYASMAHELYLRDKHLYTPIHELLDAKGEAV